MAERHTASIIEKENYAKRLKRNFDSWREVVLIINSVLLWKNKFHPWIIVTVVSVLFLELLYYNPSLLTTISLIGFILAVLDFIGPSISNAVWKQENWTASKERELEDVCKALAEAILSVKYYVTLIREMRSSRPNVFYSVAFTSLAVLAWMGNVFNNMFITYVIVLLIVMLPGSIHCGLLQAGYKTSLLHIANFLHSFSANQKKIE